MRNHVTQRWQMAGGLLTIQLETDAPVSHKALVLLAELTALVEAAGEAVPHPPRPELSGIAQARVALANGRQR